MTNACLVCGSHDLNTLNTCMICGADQVTAAKHPMIMAFLRAQDQINDLVRLLEYRLTLMTTLALQCGASFNEVTRIQRTGVPQYGEAIPKKENT